LFELSFPGAWNQSSIWRQVDEVIEMKRKLYFIALILGLLTAPYAFAEDDFGFEDDWGEEGGEEEDTRPIATIWQDFESSSFFELIYVPDDNFKYGQYNGLSNEGLHISGELDMNTMPGMDEEQDTGFWRLRADNLGLDNGSFEFTGGQQGNYTFTVSMDNFLSMGNDSGGTPFNGAGSDILFLRSDWIAANTTGGMKLDGGLYSVKPELERNQIMFELAKRFSDQLSLTASYNYERKSGEKITGAAFYIDAANPHSALLPMPVDYENNQIDLVLDYVSPLLQMQFSYLLSDLDNRYDTLIWQNPYANAFIPVVDYPNGYGGYGLPSDTRFQRLRFNGNYRITSKMKLRVDGSAGQSEVEGDLSPYTFSPLLISNTPLPIDEIDDELDTRNLYVSLLYKLSRRFTVNLKYRFDERENGLAVYPWQYVRADSADQSPALKAIFNQPHETSKEKYTVEGTWRLPKSARLTIGYDFNTVDRTFSAVEETEEDRGRIEFKMRFFKKLTARIEYSESNLAGSEYQWSQSFFNNLTVEQINLIPDDQRFNNHPLLRQYHLANRESRVGKFKLLYPMNDKWNFTLDSNLTSNDYDKSELGLTETTQYMVNLSANYMPTDAVTSYFWVSRGQSETEQTGRAFRGGIEKPANVIVPPFPDGSDPSRNWDLEEEAETSSIGAGIDWQLKENKLVLAADYVYVATTLEDRFEVFGARDLAGVDLPDQDTKLHQFTLAIDYHWRPECSFRFSYEYYKYESEDWAVDGVGLDTISKVLTLGEESPNEEINVLSLSASYRF
jgi:MtrB/PioB family decaheme-associated outer membrane protein